MATAARVDHEEARSQSAVRCFIAASPRTDLALIRALLRDRGIAALVAHEADAPGITIAQRVTALIAESDLVLAILDEGPSGANIYFEVGYAFALHKKILAVAPPGSEIPADLTGVFYIRATPRDAEPLAFGIDQLLAAPPQPRRSTRGGPTVGQPIGAVADRLLAQLGMVLAAEDGSARALKLEQIVLEALQAGAPASVVEVPRPDSGRPDLAVWSDDLEPWVGNPLLIEVKARLRSAQDAQEVRDRLEAYIKHANSGWGLVLYADGLSHEWAQSLASPPVLFMRLDEFLAALRGHGLAAIIRPLRDAAVHGTIGLHGE